MLERSGFTHDLAEIFKNALLLLKVRSEGTLPGIGIEFQTRIHDVEPIVDKVNPIGCFFFLRKKDPECGCCGVRKQLCGWPDTLTTATLAIEMAECQLVTNLEFTVVGLQQELKVFLFQLGTTPEQVSIIQKMVPTQLEQMGHIWENVDSPACISWVREKWHIFGHVKRGEQSVIAEIKIGSIDTNPNFFNLIDDERQKILLHLRVKIVKDWLLPLLEKSSDHHDLNLLVRTKDAVGLWVVLQDLADLHLVERDDGNSCQR